MKQYTKGILVWLVTAGVLLVAYDLFQSSLAKNSVIKFSEFLNYVENNEVAEVYVKNRSQVEGTFISGDKFLTDIPYYPALYEIMYDKGITIEVNPDEGRINTFWSIIISWFPIFLIIVVYIFFMRSMQAGGGKALGFGKSKAKLMQKSNLKVTFKDVAGLAESKADLEELVDFLKNPIKYNNIGSKIPKGCLLIGPPGTGKTLLAKAIAGEAGVPFFSISGSDFVEMFVGIGASRVRDMFEQGKKNAPCLIFIDEIDAVGRHRGIGLGGGNDEREQTLNQLLVEMDGFEANEGIIIIAATNRPDVLDNALLRPGRFDRQITVPIPDLTGREEILKVHLKKVRYSSNVNAAVIARGTPGFSGADLSNLINEAALLAARLNKEKVSMHELEEAKDKIMMGATRSTMIMQEEERKLTAYHEAGHAIVSIVLPPSDPIHKATIVPRGRALGMVVRLPEKERFSLPREKLYADLAVAMGGRAAEEIIFGYDKVTSGASSDIKHATDMAFAMVTEWGMSDLLGPVFYAGNHDDHYMQGKRKREISDAVTAKIDAEVKRILEEAMDQAKKILKKNMKGLHNLAQALLDNEMLTGDEIKEVIDGKKLHKTYNLSSEEVLSSLPMYEQENSIFNEDKSESEVKAEEPNAKVTNKVTKTTKVTSIADAKNSVDAKKQAVQDKIDQDPKVTSIPIAKKATKEKIVKPKKD